VPCRKLLSLLKPHSSHAVHAGHVLRSHGPDSSVGQLRGRLLQQRRRCDGGVHDVPGGTVPGHSRPGVLQGMPSRRILRWRSPWPCIIKLQHRHGLRIVAILDRGRSACGRMGNYNAVSVLVSS
jgi:hypothetical protein